MARPYGNGSEYSVPPAEGGQADEDASARFQEPAEDAAEQAALSATLAAEPGVPTEAIDAREEIAATIQQSVQDQPGAMAAQDFEGAGNIQGVSIGLAGADVGGEPGTPVLTTYLAEPATAEDVRAVVVDAMGVRAASDLPIRVVTSGVIDALANRARVRPAPGGFSVAHFRVTAGTIGCLSTGRSSPRNQRLLCLSNNHVLANSNAAQYGDCISQPGPADGGTCPNDQIAILERFVPIRFGGPTNYVDCATGWCWPDRVRRELGYQTSGGINLFRISGNIAWASLGMVVGKTGRTTQLRSGTVTGVNWSGRVNYGTAGQAFFANQIVIEGNFSAGGDSGSSIWTWNTTRNPVGLLFAGGGGFTIANPMAWVASALDINLVT
jgi:hypothetical protein